MKTITRWATVACGLGAACAIGVPAANAAPAHHDGNLQTHLLFTTADRLCAGEATVTLGHYPSQVVPNISGTTVGLAKCTVAVRYDFTNKATHKTSTLVRKLAGPGQLSDYGDPYSPGSEGVYDVKVSVDGMNVPSQTLTIDTHYDG